VSNVTHPPSPAGLGIGIGLSVATLLGWVLAVATLADLAGSDAAGNGLAQAFGLVEVVVVWLLLAALTALAAVKGSVSPVHRIAAAALVPASGVAALLALQLLSSPAVAPYRWPLLVPAAVPPLVVAFALWTLAPAAQRVAPAGRVGNVAWGATLLLCMSMLPMWQVRQNHLERAARADAAIDAALARLPDDAPLWEWTRFLDPRDATVRDGVLEKIRRLGRRQADAEQMLARGDFPLRELGSFDLEPTAPLCERARALLLARVRPLVLTAPRSKPYAAIAGQVEDALSAMTWLVDDNCACDAESRAWEAMVSGYVGALHVRDLMELRDPKRLGRALREDPAHIEMVASDAHLEAWLKFSDDPATSERALAGARGVAHRTDDAVALLQRDEFEGRLVLEHLAALDLDPTPALCQAAGASLDRQVKGIFRPPPGDRRPYDELLGRLGRGGHLAALAWLTSHGCDTGTLAAEVASLIEAYQPSPDGQKALDEIKRGRH
jgi:hypothetical protein